MGSKYKAMVLSCMDPRFQLPVLNFIKKKNLELMKKEKDIIQTQKNLFGEDYNIINSQIIHKNI